MGTPFRQESFGGGELSPRLWGRTGLAKYFIGLRRLRNFFVSVEGAAMNRAGTLQVRAAADETHKVRLIEFIFSEEPNQAYMLEFGHLYMRLHVNGETVAIPAAPAWVGGTDYAAGAQVSFAGSNWTCNEAHTAYTPGDTYDSYISLPGGFGGGIRLIHVPWGRIGTVGDPVQVVTPYTENDLERLKFAQESDVLTMTHGSHPPYELKRYSHSTWTFAQVSFQARPFWSPGTPAVRYADLTAEDAASAHYAKRWVWAITVLGKFPDGTSFESLPFEITHSWREGHPLWAYKTTYALDALVFLDGMTFKSQQGANRANDPLESLSPDGGVTPGDTTWWAQDETSPSTVLQLDPLPEKVVLFADRDIHVDWAAAGTNPDYEVLGWRVYRGRDGKYGYVGETQGATEQSYLDDGISPDFAATPPIGTNPFLDANPTAVTFFEQRRVFATLGTINASRTGDYSNFDRHSPSLDDDAVEIELASRKREIIRSLVGMNRLVTLTNTGAWSVSGAGPQAPLTPTSIDAKSNIEIGASWVDPLVVGDVILYPRVKGSGVRDLLFDSAGLGKLNGTDLTLLSRHLFAKHQIVDWTYQEDPWSVIWAVRDDGKLLSLTYVREQEVWAWALHETAGLVESIACIPEGDEDAVYLVVRRQTGDGIWHRYIERMASRQLTFDENDEADPAANVFLDGAVTKGPLAAGAPVTSLGHLEGRTVVALADGQVIRTTPTGTPLVVTGGQVTLADPQGAGFTLVHVGLPYVSELELLDLAMQGRDIRLAEKSVGRVSFEVENSRGLQVAETVDVDESEWQEWDQRAVSDQYGVLALVDGLFERTIFSSWNRKGRAALRQVEPLPCTVLAVTREVDLGGG